VVRADAPLTTSRDVAALAITEALARPHLARQVVNVVDGQRQLRFAREAGAWGSTRGSAHRDAALP
jgi:hypothetical protein